MHARRQAINKIVNMTNATLTTYLSRGNLKGSSQVQTFLFLICFSLWQLEVEFLKSNVT